MYGSHTAVFWRVKWMSLTWECMFGHTWLTNRTSLQRNLERKKSRCPKANLFSFVSFVLFHLNPVSVCLGFYYDWLGTINATHRGAKQWHYDSSSSLCSLVNQEKRSRKRSGEQPCLLFEFLKFWICRIKLLTTWNYVDDMNHLKPCLQISCDLNCMDYLNPTSKN